MITKYRQTKIAPPSPVDTAINFEKNVGMEILPEEKRPTLCNTRVFIGVVLSIFLIFLKNNVFDYNQLFRL
jgi:hypothetical protein